MASQTVNLTKVGLPTEPALENVQPGKPARRLHVHQMLSAQDHALTGGRRPVAWYSWGDEYDHPHGHLAMSDGDTAGVNTGTDDRSPYPEAGTTRTLLELDGVPVTPGHALAVECLHLPSGATFTADAVDGGAPQTYTSTGAHGEIEVSVVWDDGTVTETVTTTLDLEPATAAPYNIPDAEGAAWLGMRQTSPALNFPPGVLFDPAEVVQWSAPGVKVDITIKAKGCARIVDLVVYEVPFLFGIDDGDTPGPGHVYADYQAPRTSFPDEYPTEGAASGDERFGAYYALEVAQAQETQLGPACFCWSSRRERHIDRGWTTTSDPDPATITGTSETVLGASSSGTTTESPRIGLGALAYGRRFAQSDVAQVMSENGCARIAFAAKWSVSAGVGALRLQSADYSKVELSTTSTSYTWSKATTDLACGAHPLDGFTGLLSGENSGSNDVRVRYVWAHYWPE